MQIDLINWLLNVVVYGVPVYVLDVLPLLWWLGRKPS